jgi:transcriptional regulator with XRE-family HTH domain
MKLRDYRVQNNLTQSQLGNLIGISAVAICRYENGVKPKPDVMSKIVEITQGAVTPNDFYDLPANEPDGEAA